MERQYLGLAMCALLALAAAPASALACSSPKTIGGWIGGNGDVATNEIRIVKTLESKDTGDDLGWFYFLANGNIYFQPALTVTKKTRQGKQSVALVAARAKAGASSVRVVTASAEAAAAAVMHLATNYMVTEDQIPQPWLALVHHQLETEILICK